MALNKYIHISIKNENEMIGECEFLTLSILDDSSEITFSNLKQTKEIRLGDKLNVSVFLNENYLMKFNIVILGILNRKEFNYKVKYFSNNLYKFNQLYLDIFNQWRLGNEVNWRNFKSVKQKNAWIRSCNILNGVATSIDLKKSYVINGNDIKHPIDLHCLFGELFLGEKGYFGSEYNSFVDCLTQAGLDNNSDEINSEIIILGYDKLDKVISKYKNHDGYVDAIINQLTLSGFDIIKK